MNGRDDAEAQVARIEALIQAVEDGEDGATRDAARALSAAILAFHGEGLGRIFDRLAEAGAPGRLVAEACARDDLVAGLLALHDLPRKEPPLVPLRRGRDAPAPPPPPMPELSFTPLAVRAVPHTATPLLSLDVRIGTALPGQRVEAMLLRCQVRIEPARRALTTAERATAGDLLGEPRPRDGGPPADGAFLWTHTGTAVPAFEGETTIDLPLPCTYDLAVAPARYLGALDGGAAPLLLLFSGTTFLARADGALRAEPIPWTREARFAMPLAVWQEALDLHYPGTAPLLLRRDLFERLQRHRASLCLASWDEALASLLDAAGAT